MMCDNLWNMWVLTHKWINSEVIDGKNSDNKIFIKNNSNKLKVSEWF